MIEPDVIQQKRLEFLRRSRELRAAQFSDPVERTYTLAAIRSGQVRENLRTWLRAALADFPTTNSVYTLDADRSETATSLRVAFRSARAIQDARRKQERDFSASEDNHQVPDGGSCLYVGGSRTGSLGTRLCQHLDKVNNGTYALNMRCWVPEDLAGHVTIKVCAITGPRNDAMANDVEDALWQSKQPIFGRLGR